MCNEWPVPQVEAMLGTHLGHMDMFVLDLLNYLVAAGM